jgi:hypothetical protein
MRLLGLAFVAGLLLTAPAAAAAAEIEPAEVTFEQPRATATFGQGIDFSVSVDLDAAVDRVELLIGFPGAAGPQVVEVPAPSATGSTTLRHRYDLLADGHIAPNTRIESSWRVRSAATGATATSAAISILYADDRFDWQTEQSDIVRVHWYEGPDSFGERALLIAEDGIREAEELLGVSETEPIDFFIYASQDELYDALGPATRENVGGQAHAEIRTLFALITPSEIDDPWVGIVIPHELTHLVFDTAVDNPYHFPPRWLNEGLAVYLSQGYVASDRSQVEDAVEAGTLVPLDGLAGTFPSTASGFYLAYAESVSAVDYLIRTHGQDALVVLITSYADGKTDDEAFTEALGIDAEAFDAAWFEDLGATVPPAVGPVPAPGGPLPDGWTGPVPVASPGSSGQPAPSPGPSPIPGPSDPPPVGAVLLGAALGVVLAAGIGLAATRRPRRPAAPRSPGPPEPRVGQAVSGDPER